MSIKAVKIELRKYASLQRAKQSQYFFKTGPGQYGEGDVFIGVSVPDQRKVAIKYNNLSLSEVEKLFHSKIHEERLTAGIILVTQFGKADQSTQEEIYNFYIANKSYINNWDLVDSTAPYIIGEYLWTKFIHNKSSTNDTQILTGLAKSESVWDRRIAIMSTFYFIRQQNTEVTFTIADILLYDKHDLIQKAVGWMLREVGKNVGIEKEEQFLKSRYLTMPRTMLRYSIERFPEPKRKAYLTGTI